MKIISEESNGPTVIQLEADESIISFDKDGRATAIVSDPEGDGSDEDREVNASAWSCAVAMFAVTDDGFRKMIERWVHRDSGAN